MCPLIESGAVAYALVDPGLASRLVGKQEKREFKYMMGLAEKRVWQMAVTALWLRSGCP
jgi:hypothetical protein